MTLEEQIREAEERWLEIWTRGPSDLAWEELPPQVGDPAPDLELEDSDGARVRLSSFWEDQPALLIFWRHYGCGCGVARAGRLNTELSDYRAAGARVVVIGQGEPERAVAYAEQHGLDCLVLCDPEVTAYRAYGLKEGKVSQILFDAPEELWAHDRPTGLELIEQRRQMGRPMVDNPWLLPGEFVVDRSGVVRLAYRYQYCEDFPDPRVLVAAVREARESP